MASTDPEEDTKLQVRRRGVLENYTIGLRGKSGRDLFDPFLDSSGFFLHPHAVTYSDISWQHLGSEVAYARRAAGYADTKAWVAKVGKSDRQLLGLERGEPKGRTTLSAVEAALEWPDGWCYRILSGERAGPPDRTPATLAARFAPNEPGVADDVARYSPVDIPDAEVQRMSESALFILGTLYSEQSTRLIRAATGRGDMELQQRREDRANATATTPADSTPVDVGRPEDYAPAAYQEGSVGLAELEKSRSRGEESQVRDDDD